MEPAKITSDLFEPLTLTRTTPGRAAVRRKRPGFWGDALRRFVRNKGALIGFFLLLVIAVMTFVAPALSPHDPYEQKLEAQNLPPGGDHFSEPTNSGGIYGPALGTGPAFPSRLDFWRR